VDITFDTELVPEVGYGIRSTELVKELCKETNSLIATVILFKKILHKHSLDKPFFGGINSYMLIMLTVAFLRASRITAIRKCFINMLEYYGKTFDVRRVAIVGGYLMPVYNRIGTLFISDPYRPHINIAGTVSKFNEIQACFASYHDYLIKTKQDWYYEYNEDFQILNSIIN